MGNGGFVAGTLAKHLEGAVRVTLRRPCPLDRLLTLEVEDRKTVRLLDGDLRIAEAEPAELDLDVPDSVGYDAAVEASERFRAATDHVYPQCFVCGPDRQSGDALRIHPGPVEGREIVAAGWIPDSSLADEDGRIRTEVVWAALDCPSYFGILERETTLRDALLGQITAVVLERPRPGDRYVVTGWPGGRDGRKLFGGAALFTDDGRLLALSRTIWIEPRTEAKG